MADHDLRDPDPDVCGLCGEPGADKIPHPHYWPTETRPDTEFVHATCEVYEACADELRKVLTPGHGFNSERSQRAENGGRP